MNDKIPKKTHEKLMIRGTNPQISRIRELKHSKNRELECPYCKGIDIKKRGIRNRQSGSVQLYFCKKCEKTFTPKAFKNKHHDLKIVLDSISTYNLGYSLNKTIDIISNRHNTKIKPSTLNSWIKEYASLCRYSRMRSFGKKLFSPEQIIQEISLYHRQIYKYRVHQAKLAMLLQEDRRHYKLEPLREFLMDMYEECPSYMFKDSQRASKEKPEFNLDQVIIRGKHNYANRLAELVLNTVEENKQRHEQVQKFFIHNDSVTVATEVPVYLLKEDIDHMQTQLDFHIPIDIEKVLTGHIDLIQLRNGIVHILDYKPKAEKEHPIEQLTLYALAMSRLTGLKLLDFKCAWFDENTYHEFFPLHIVYKLKKNQKIPINQRKLNV